MTFELYKLSEISNSLSPLYVFSMCMNVICSTVPIEWSPWSPWSECSPNAPCTAGSTRRMRVCSQEGECDGDSIETRHCENPCITSELARLVLCLKKNVVMKVKCVTYWFLSMFMDYGFMHKLQCSMLYVEWRWELI